MSNSLDSFLTRIGDVTIERVAPRSNTRNSDVSGGTDGVIMTSSGSNHSVQGGNDEDSEETGGEASDSEFHKKNMMMHRGEREDIHSEGSGDDMDLDETIDTEIGVRMDSERQHLESPCPDDDVEAVNILDTLPLEGAPIEGQEVSEADLLGKPLLKDDDTESMDNSNPTHSDLDEDGEISKRRADSDESDPAKKKQKKDDGSDEGETKAEKKLANMRRNIREVMDETQLDEATLSAQRQEMERLRRVQEQQRIIREVQRQIANHRQTNRGQPRVISLLQGKQNEIGTTLSHSPSGPSHIKSPNTMVMSMNSPNSQQSSTMSQPGVSQRRPLSSMRWQKGRGGYQNQSMMSKVINKIPVQNVLQQRIRMMTPSVSISPVVPKKEPMEHQAYYSDSDISEAEAEEIEKEIHGKFPMPKSPKPLKGKDVVTISSSSESSDDDCIVLSDPSGGEETDNEDDPSNSGMHTNDRYNIPDEHSRVLINVGHPDTEPDVFLAPQVARIIKPHQIGGIRFLFDNIVESIERYKSSSGFGCILAHSMGLGKTLQVTSFCDIFFRCTTAKTVLCIMPINTLQNWLAEFNMWLPYEDPDSIKLSEIPKKAEFDQKQDVKEENSNQTDISTLSSRSMSTDSRSHQEMPLQMTNMMGGSQFHHPGYENPTMGNYYQTDMMNKSRMEQNPHIPQNYHHMYPPIPSIPNYPGMKQEIDCTDSSSSKPLAPIQYGNDNLVPGNHYPSQMYPTMENRSMYPSMNPQNPPGSYPGYQNSSQYPNYPPPISQDNQIKPEKTNTDMGIKKEPEEPATKEEGTSTTKDENSEEKKDVEKVKTPFSVDAPIGLELRPRHFKLHILNDSHKTMAARARVIKEWQKTGGVLLIGYELYRQLSLKKPNKGKRKRGQPVIKDTVDVEEEDKNKGLLEEMHGALVNPGPDLVICDEGHRIKNSHASISLALKQMRTKRRIVLTGYPLQNNLLEYWCMVDFVRPNYLGTKAEFCNMFERPIQNGQCIDSTPQDIRLMRYRAHVLHALLEGFVQRRSHSVLQVSLPRKEEYILLVRMTPHQRKLYDTFMNQVVKTRAVPNPLKAFAVCCKIWNHPDILYHFLRKRQANEEDDLDLEETIEKSAPGNKRTKARGKGEKKGKKVNTIKNKPAASVQPNAVSTTGSNDNESENQSDNKGGNFQNFPQQIPPTNFQNSQQNFQQNYQEFRPNEQNNYYRNETAPEFNEFYNNQNQQRYPNPQYQAYPQGNTNYPAPQQNYQQNQNQNQNFVPAPDQSQDNQQKYPAPQNTEFRADQGNNTNYDVPGMFPRQSYGFQDQRNYPATSDQPINPTHQQNLPQQNYQNQIPNQNNVPTAEYTNYQHDQSHNYPQNPSNNNQMFRTENQINHHSFQSHQNQNQPSQNPPTAPGYINNQNTQTTLQNPAPIISNTYPQGQPNQTTNYPQNPPQQAQMFHQNQTQQPQQHNYMNNQNQMRGYQNPQASFPNPQGHGYSSERQPYPVSQSGPSAANHQQNQSGSQVQRYPAPSQSYNQSQNQNGPPNQQGNYQNPQNQFKNQDERFNWQGNYQQSMPQQEHWDPANQGNRFQGNYFQSSNYPQNSYDYQENSGEVTIKTENKGMPPQQPNIIRGQNSVPNYESKKDASVGIQSQPMPPTNYIQNTQDGISNAPRPLQNMNFNNKHNPSDLAKEEDKEKDEIIIEKEKEEKSDDEILLKEEEKDLKNSPNGKEDPGIPYDWATELMKGYVPGLIDASAKMTLFFCILEEAIRLGDRVLAFSQSLFTLNLIEDFLARNDLRNPDGTTEQWIKNVNYYRLDGSTSALEREKLINEFNHNPKIHLFLVSTRAGSLGINLVGANRAIVFDASWNPCHDTQAVCRVYRYGQRKPCYVYRLVTDNCLERKIYDRQISKQGMADRVVDQCNPDAHLSLKEATTLSWDFEEDSQVQDFSSSKDSYTDEVMHTVLEKHSSLLTKQPFHHESLLVDRKDKKLSQAEKRLARRGYELEKMAANCSRPSYNYIPGNTATRAGSLQIRAIRGGDTGVAPKPVASVRPMQQRGAEGLSSRGVVGSRWIPAEVWQRQGMSAQEMTLPLDVVIPTNSPDKSSIVLKAGQRVMVLKSPKGIYMQLESGKIIAIRTALKINQQKREEEPKKTPAATSPRAQKPDVSFPLRNNTAISIIPKSTTASAPPTPRPLSRPSSGSGYRQFPDKDSKKPKPVLPTSLPKGNANQMPLTNQVSLQRISKGKEMDHSSAGENSNSSDSQPRTDQRVEEVRLEDIVGEAGANTDYNSSIPSRMPNSDVIPDEKTHDFGTGSMPSQKIAMQSVQTQHTETERIEMIPREDKSRLGQPEMKDQLRPGNYRYSAPPMKDENDEIIIEEPVVRPLMPIPHQQPVSQHSQAQQTLPPPQVMPQRQPEIPKTIPPEQNHPQPTTPVKDRQPEVQEAPQTDPHGIPQAYPYTQYPRYYDYPDPRSRGMSAAPYGSYYPGGPTKTQTDTIKPEERGNYPQAAAPTAQPVQIPQQPPAAEPVEPIKTENIPPTTSANVPTAFSHPGTRYPGSYPPAPYDPYSQHYAASPASTPTYPPSGTPGYGAYGGPSYNTEYARMYSPFHGPPPPVTDPYMHRGYAPPPTNHPSNYYAPFPHPLPPPYPNYSFMPPYSNPNVPNESQPPAQ